MTIGFFGKVPSKGDFVERRLPRGFVAPWEDWLAGALTDSREALGADWVALYLESPLWRFALPAEACGPQGMAGVLMPSIDRVGRHYPLCLAMPLPPGTAPSGFAAANDAWYAALEDLALTALGPSLDLDALAEALGTLAAAPAHPAGEDEAIGRMDLAAIGRQPADRALWWTLGAAQVPPSLLVCDGMLATRAYESLIDGQWSRV